VIPLTQMNHPALQLSGLKVGEYLLEISEIRPDDFDTVRMLPSPMVSRSSNSMFGHLVEILRKPQFLDRVRKVIEHGVHGGLTCKYCNSGFVDRLNFLEKGESAYCATYNQWFLIPELESPGATAPA
jgi:hypothetical protein